MAYQLRRSGIFIETIHLEFDAFQNKNNVKTKIPLLRDFIIYSCVAFRKGKCLNLHLEPTMIVLYLQYNVRCPA